MMPKIFEGMQHTYLDKEKLIIEEELQNKNEIEKGIENIVKKKTKIVIEELKHQDAAIRTN